MAITKPGIKIFKGSPGNALFLLLLAILGCANSNRSSRPKSLTSEHREAIRVALRSKSLPSPSSLEISDVGWLVATYEISNGAQARDLGERAVLAIREAMLPFKFDGHYRVTVNGSSPGTGLILRYGSARFTDRLEWEAGLK